MDSGTEPSPNLHGVAENDLFGEIRRRQIAQYRIRDALGLDSGRGKAPADLRYMALLILALISVLLISFIGWIAVKGGEVPEILTALAGASVGAIAGILSGAATNAVGEGPVRSSDGRP